MLLKELYDKFDLDSGGVPPRLLDVDFENDITYFKGETQLYGSINMTINVTVNLKRFTRKLVDACILFCDGETPDIDVSQDDFERFFNEIVLVYSFSSKDNFDGLVTYNLLGGVISEA